MSKENPNELKIINKNERLKYQKLLYTYKQQIADLEAKLAESENQCRECKHLNKKIELNIKNKLMNETQQLKQQLEKSEKSKESYRLQNEQHHLQLLQFYSRLGVEAFGADIHEKALETLMIMKEQLAEKEKEIEKLNACVDFYKSYSVSFQEKIIDELEKVKRYIDDKAYYLEEENFGIEINEYIDNQINGLKGKVEDEKRN